MNNFYFYFNIISILEKLCKYYVKYNDKYEILYFKEGDIITISNIIQDERRVFVEFHKNIKINEISDQKIPIFGILRLILIKYISSLIKDINQINSNEMKKLISILQNGTKQKEEDVHKDIKLNLEESSGRDILAYTEYVCSIMTDEKINYLLKNTNLIFKYWSILSLYSEFSQIFESELKKELKNSYFEYSLISLSIYEQPNRKHFLKEKKNYKNLEVKYLYHGTPIDSISEILIQGFLYPKKAFYGMGIYFTDMLDYLAFYSSGKDFTSKSSNFCRIPYLNETFSCVSSEVYYDKTKKKIFMIFHCVFQRWIIFLLMKKSKDIIQIKWLRKTEYIMLE